MPPPPNSADFRPQTGYTSRLRAHLCFCTRVNEKKGMLKYFGLFKTADKHCLITRWQYYCAVTGKHRVAAAKCFGRNVVAKIKTFVT